MEGNLQTQKEALAASIEMEKKGHEFYTRTAQKSPNKNTQEVFTWLANEELKHIEAIKKFHENELAGDKSNFDEIVGSVDPKQARAAIVKLFDGFEKNVPVDKEDLDALNFARDFENNGEQFYKKASEKASDPDVKKLFDFLVEEEQRHFRMIDDSMAFLENPEEWFHRKEKWHVEG
ncbi:MAG: hypothetical protein GF307_12480 [candidate division Zixibacteria bacterium]|nr:hypothetical protein [candidate division Zixibacteria bacterium]